MNELTPHILGALATVYLTCCFVYLDGPFDVFMRIRSLVARRGWWQLNELLECPWCTGFWCALVVGLAVCEIASIDMVWLILMVPAYAACAGRLLEGVIDTSKQLDRTASRLDKLEGLD